MIQQDYGVWPLTPGEYGNAFAWTWRPGEKFLASVRGSTYMETQEAAPWSWLGPSPCEGE